VDRERGVAWVKPDLVERCLKTVPRKFVLASRDGRNDAVIDGEQMHHMTDGQASFTLDEKTGERRTSTLHDLALSTLLADALAPIKVMCRPSSDRRLDRFPACSRWPPRSCVAEALPDGGRRAGSGRRAVPPGDARRGVTATGASSATVRISRWSPVRVPPEAPTT